MKFLPLLLESESVSFWDKVVNFLKTQILSTESTLTTGEKFSLAGQMILRGLGTVFIVLIMLWIVIAIFGAISKATVGKEKKKAPAVAAPTADDTPSASSDDGEIVAAIMAAVEAYRAEEGLAGRPYRVVSFKKRNVKNRIGSDD